MKNKCPYCGVPIEFDDEFTNFEDGGDYITTTANYECECGEVMTIRATFVWDGNFEIA